MRQRIIVAVVTLLTFLILGFAFVRLANATTVTPIFGGGTGTSTPPTNGQTLKADSNGNREYVGSGLAGGTFTTSGTCALLSYLATSLAESGGQLAAWNTTSG